ncbi:MAG TPA: CDP-alcohol phosphatidyltransferase family protein [Gammaproteobacteria bacterium]|nr:CDP-alcohol phosphatidyltransferase family protein [Gammaproteobacteria bacterium]
MRQLPNLLTSLRLLLIAPFVYALLTERFTAALGLFTLAGITDALDGYLADRFNWHTWLGSVLDPLADKMLLVAAFVALALAGLAPVWLVGLVLLRDIVIVSGALAYHLLIARFQAAPSYLSKLNTLMQLGFVFITLVNAVFAVYGDTLANILIGLVVSTTVASGLHYVWVWTRKAILEKTRV